MSLTTSGSATKSWIVCFGFERLVRVLEDELDPAPVLAQLLWPHRRADVARPRTSIRPAVWRVSLTMTRPVVVLPLPDSPTSAEDLAPHERQVDAVDRPDDAARPAAERVDQAAADREVDLEPVEPERARRRLDAGEPPRRSGVGRRRRSASARRAPSTGTPSLALGIQVAGDADAIEASPRAGRPREQTSIANEQRGANRQPGGGLRRSGGEPGMTSSVRRSAWMFGNAASSFWVYGWRGRRKTSSTGPSSATRPAYMIMTRSHVSAMTDRSWVMRMSDSPSSCAEVLEQLQDLGLDHDVERGRRLVADDDRRVAGEGHRDHRPLAHPARQLVRVGRAARLRDADELEQLAGPLAGPPRATRRGAPRSARRSGRGPAGPG